MIIAEQVSGAFRNLFHHKLRACLTMLGMVFGVGAVIAMIAISEGARLEVLSSISDLGADSILILSLKPSLKKVQDAGPTHQSMFKYGLTFRDRERILAAVPGLASHVTIRDLSPSMGFGSRSLPQRVLATEPSYLATAHLKQQRGRFLCALDCERHAPVAVIGVDMVREHFHLQDPLGRLLTIHQMDFTVVGVVKAGAASGPGGTSADELNHSIFLAEPAARTYLGLMNLIQDSNSSSLSLQEISQLVLHLQPDRDVIATGKFLRRLVEQAHPLGDVEVVVPLELLEQKRRTQRTFTIIMSSIASISLLVGGIGITNIMLASVLERTREIGIRRAVGARRGDILFQFLTETVLMSLLGGVAGIVLGIVVAVLVNRLAGWPILITWWSVVLSVGISVVVGLLAGVSPAVTAARLQPVQALRHA